jgi:hypothetical protein
MGWVHEVQLVQPRREGHLHVGLDLGHAQGQELVLDVAAQVGVRNYNKLREQTLANFGTRFSLPVVGSKG